MLALLLSCFAVPAFAQADIISPDTISGLVDLRVALADGEPSWLDDGFGKTRFGGGDSGGWKAHATVADAAVVWKPKFTWEWSATVDAEMQPDQKHAVDLIEAYVSYKPVPRSEWRFGGRFGLFYPPISLEHGGPGWTVADTITPSAINTWVAEEVKVVGAEGTVTRDFGGNEISATAAVFGFNDTSGTLLTYRGWALHDYRAQAFGDMTLPTFTEEGYDDEYEEYQAKGTRPTIELADRVGYYGRVEWRAPGNLAFNAFFYDNDGDRVSGRDLQWSWATRFWNFGATWEPDDKTRVFGQYMDGVTLQGERTPMGVFWDMRFRSAYVAISRKLGPGKATLRGDWFETIDHSFQQFFDNNEEGWAVTGAYKYPLSEHADLLLEALHVSSDRADRAYAEIPTKQDQTTLQAALRFSF